MIQYSIFKLYHRFLRKTIAFQGGSAMKHRKIFKSFVSVLLLLSMLASLFPLPTSATEGSADTVAEEKAPVKAAGTNYTSIINALAKPVPAYSAHQDYTIVTVNNGQHCTIPFDKNDPYDYFVMLVTVGGKSYAFAPMNLGTSGSGATVSAVSVTIDANDYLTFSSESDLLKAILTLKENTGEQWSYERLLVRQDGRAVVPIGNNGNPHFSTATGSNETFGFYYKSGSTGVNLFKNIYLTSTATNRTNYRLVFNGSAFILGAGSNTEYSTRGESNTFYFYKMTSISKKLYTAIQSAKTYATGNANGQYDAELYAGFITLLEDCIAVYNKYNHYLSKTELTDKAIYQNAMDTRADSLNKYISLLAAAGNSPKYQTMLNSVSLTSRGWGNAFIDFKNMSVMSELNGSYFFVAQSGSTNYLMNPKASSTEGTIAATAVTITNNSVVGATIDQAIDFIYEEKPAGVADDTDVFLRLPNGKFMRGELKNSTPLLTFGHAHEGFGFALNTEKDQVAIWRNINTAIDGTNLGTNNTRLNLNATSKTFTLEKSTSNTCYYRMFRLTWSTEDLLTQIKKFATAADTYKSSSVSGVFADFLKCYDESIAMFLRYNVSHTPEQLEDTNAIQAELKAQAIRLSSYEDILKKNTYAQVISNLDSPYNELYREPVSRYHAMDIRYVAGAVYYIVHTHDNGKNYAVYADSVHSNISGDYLLIGAEATISDNRIQNAKSEWAFDLRENKSGDTVWTYEFSTYPVYNTSFYVGANEIVTANGGPNTLYYYTGKQVAFQAQPYNDGLTLHCNKNFDNVSGNERYYLQYVPDQNIFRPQLTDTLTESSRDRYTLYLVSDHVLDLYRALTRMTVYATGNTDGRYPATEYANFLSCLQESIDLYQYYNTPAQESWDMATVKSTLDAQAEKLLAYVNTLTLGDSLAPGYIDIPVEILDFRADGFMFEYYDATYGMSHAKNVEAYYGMSTGSLKSATNKGTTYTLPDGTVFTTDVHTNLTEKNLVDGKMVYTEKTLKQIAYSILSGINGIETNVPSPNTRVQAKANDLITKAGTYSASSTQWKNVLGSASATFAKTTTKKNGGDLKWEQITTAYDLAYYILTYLWRPVTAQDTMGDGSTIYNVSVPERSVLRLYRDESSAKKLYTLDSYSWVGYSGAYSFNAYPAASNFNHASSPNFTPIDGLGFEKGTGTSANTDASQSLYETNNHSSDGTNFHFTLHAKGSFVYYEEQDLYFEFLGDDDVYFYINGQRVLDLGGGHKAAGGTLYLNDKATELKLVEGGVYSFDMFYAERKTSASNLRFLTNILLVAPDTAISKGQYAIDFNGTSMVDPATGKGTPLADNATVRVGDTTAYSFDLSNTRDYPVFDLEFTDNSLGVSMTKNSIKTYTGTLANGSTGTSLTNPDANHGNGVVTQYSNLIIEYSTLNDSKTPQTSPVYELSATEMANKIKATYAVASGSQYMTVSRLTAGRYKVKVSNATELKALLEAGIPTMCNLSIYGFLRKTTVDDLPYRNELLVTYSYPNSTKVSDGNSTVSGKAVRQIRVLAHSSMPQVRKMEVVMDYGKAVTVPLEDLSDLIRFEDGSPVIIGSVAGFLKNAYNGQILKKLPTDIFCTKSGQTATGTQGSYSRSATGFTFTPGQFLTQIETLYAVVQVEDFYYGTESSEQIPYIVLEMTFTPANIMYYETDFAAGIFDLVQTTGEDWHATTDGTNAADSNQDYERPAGTVSNTSIDREHIPADAFFADFNGEGDAKRYRDQPQYKGYDYDAYYEEENTKILRPTNWVINEVNSEKAVIDPEAGTLSFVMKPSKTSVYVQTGHITVIPNSTLNLIPVTNSFAQVRLKLKNFTTTGTDVIPQVRIYYYDYDSTREDKLQFDYVEIGSELLNSDEYFTVMIPLSAQYENEAYIDRLRVQLWNVKSISDSQLGVFTMDYLYVGPETGISEDVYDDYLFFDFTGTQSDILRYSSSAYGGYNFDAVNSDGTATHWAGRDTGFSKGTATISNGTLSVKPKDATFGSIYADTQSGGNTDKTHLINYDASNAEVYQMRFKVTGITDDNDSASATIHFYYESGTVSNPYDKHDEASPVYFDSSYLSNGKYITVQGTIPQAIRDRGKYDRLIMWVGGFPNSGGSTSAVLTFDYIYIGPKDKLEEINAAQSSLNKMGLDLPASDHLYFDFEDNNAAKTRYSNTIYGAKNFGLKSGWATNNTYVEISSVGNGTMVLKDKTNLTNGTEAAGGNIFCSAYPLNFQVGQKDYLRVRLKIDNAVPDANTNRALSIRADFRDTNDVQNSSESVLLDWDKVNNGYFTVDIPLNTAAYRNIGILRRFNVVVVGTQCATVTIDYFYVGPLTDSDPIADTLYFGFGDTEKDRQRYNTDAYNYTNYDVSYFSSPNVGLKNWSPSTCALALDPENGYGIVTGNKIDNGWFALYTRDDLNFRATEDTIVQVRVKFENAIGAYNNNDGRSFLNLYYSDTYGGHGNSIRIGNISNMDEAIEQGWMIFTTAIKDVAPYHSSKTANYMWDVDVIKRIGLSSNYAISVDETKPIMYVDYLYIGPGKLAPEPVYGSDSSYDNDSKLSNGSSYVVEGQGVKTQANPNTYTEGSFDFKGTGFDLISRTGSDQATIRLEVTKKGDAKPIKTLTVNNKGELELYQIPVVSVQGLEYGEYNVTLWVNKALVSDYVALSRGGTFHLDAVRIYDPMGTGTALPAEVQNIYTTDKEAYPHIKEIRNILLTADKFSSITGTTTGAVFVDYTQTPTDGVDINNHIADTVATYDKAGPKNEVYLAPKQAVAFKLQISTTYAPVSVDVGAKTIRPGSTANLVAGIVTKTSATSDVLTLASRKTVTLSSATAQYYSLSMSNANYYSEDGKRYCYIVLYNDGTEGDIVNILSITDIKLTYAQAPEAGLPKDAYTDPEVENPATNFPGKRGTDSYFDFLVDGRTPEAAALLMEAVLETPILADGTTLLHSLNLASDISVNYLVSKAALAEYESFYLECLVDGREEAQRIEAVEKGNYYYFTLDGLTAVQIGNVITATLYMKKDGRTYYTRADIYSIAQYAYSQLAKAEASIALKTLCAQLLRYGAAAQLYKGYRTHALADAGMTDANRAYLTDPGTMTFGNTNVMGTEYSTPAVSWVGKSLDLNSKVSVLYVINTACYTGDIADLQLKVSYLNHKGEACTVTLTELTPYGSSGQAYAFCLDSLLAAELRTTLTAQVYAGSTPVSNTLTYSPDTYGNNKTGTLGTLCKALFAYSDAAKAYFAN